MCVPLEKSWLRPWLSYFHSSGGTGKKVTAILRRSPSRGLCTPEVKIASVPVPAFTGNKMASSNLQIREEQPPDRPEPAQIARDRSLKQMKSIFKTREASDGKKVLLHDRDNQFPGQHLSVIIGNTMFCTACKEVVSSKKCILSSHCAMPLCPRTY